MRIAYGDQVAAARWSGASVETLLRRGGRWDSARGGAMRHSTIYYWAVELRPDSPGKGRNSAVLDGAALRA